MPDKNKRVCVAVLGNNNRNVLGHGNPMRAPSIDLGALRSLSTSVLADAIAASTPRQDLVPTEARNGAGPLIEARHLNGAMQMRQADLGLQARKYPDGLSEADRHNLMELVTQLNPGSDKTAWQVLLTAESALLL
jgi:hypothetical protein